MTLVERQDAALRAMKIHPIFQRRACGLIAVDPKTVRRELSPDFVCRAGQGDAEALHAIRRSRYRVPGADDVGTRRARTGFCKTARLEAEKGIFLTTAEGLAKLKPG
jgi:hypothetical protein